jgi:hypothetical protein
MIIAQAAQAMRSVLPEIALRHARRTGSVVISATHPIWP